MAGNSKVHHRVPAESLVRLKPQKLGRHYHKIPQYIKEVSAKYPRIISDYFLRNYRINLELHTVEVHEERSESAECIYKSLFGKFGSTASGRVFGFLSAGFDAWNAADAFFGAKPDAVKGALYTTSAVGGTLAAVSGTSFAASLGIGAWGGPVGIGLVVVSALGLSLKDRVDQSNLHMNGTSAAFLQHAGFSEAASNALVDQSGEGWSPMTMLQRYAEAKGYRLDDPAHRQPFVDWVNNMPADKLDKLRDQLHFALDDFDGDVGRLGNDPTVYRPTTFIHGGGGFPAKVNANVSTVGHIDAVVRDFGLPDLPKA